jgi:hypothetical protein
MDMIFQAWSISVFQTQRQRSTMSSKDLKTRFDNQFALMNCQMFPWGLSSGERGGSGKSEMLPGALRPFAVPSGLIEDQNSACAGGALVAISSR